MFHKQDIITFKGLNSNVAPELIEDGEARDIYNFHHEKIGKLVSRNGYIIGLFADTCINTYVDKINVIAPFCSFDAGLANEIAARRSAYINNKGCIGIGELILENKWDSIDTDRVMVYMVRFGINPYYDGDYNKTEFYSDIVDAEATLKEQLENPGSPVYPSFIPLTGPKIAYKNEQNPYYQQESFAGYLFSPLSGKYTNTVLYGLTSTPHFNHEEMEKLNYQDVKVFDRITKEAQDVNMDIQLYAPNKSATADDEWQRQYVTMNQYKNKLIISDVINGDTVIQDEYTEPYNQNQQYIHDLIARPNCLHPFDVSIVSIDDRTQDGEENAEGIESGMALYKYELPKKFQQMSDDKFENRLANLDFLGYFDTEESGSTLTNEQRWAMLATAYVKGRINVVQDGTKIKYLGAYFGNDSLANATALQGRGQNVLHLSKNYVKFTNAEEPSEFVDALGTVQLKNDEYFDEDGVKKSEIPADVYIWNDYKIKYKLSSGKTLGRKFLTELERTFTKKSTGTTRATTLNELDEYGRQVPLSVYRYRFVWDFGNGVYSAPSAEMSAPDLLWSAYSDADMIADQASKPVTANYPVTHNEYNRPLDYGIELETKNVLDNNIKLEAFYNRLDNTNAASPYQMPTYNLTQKLNPTLWDGNGLTNIGKHFFNIKKELYKGRNHRFGIDETTDFNLNILTSIKKLGEFSTLMTAFFSKSDLPLKGIIYEGVEIAYNKMYDGATWLTNNNLGIAGTVSENVVKGDLNQIYGAYLGLYIINEPGTFIAPMVSKLTVPIFKSNSHSYTYNSLFDDEGRLRLGWRNYSNSYPTYQIVFPGFHPNVESNIAMTGGSDDWKYNRIRCFPTIHYPKFQLHETSDLYLNIVCAENDSTNKQDMSNGCTYDSNLVTDEKYETYRPNTILRAVKEENDRLTNCNQTDTQALDRLLLSNLTIEIPIIGHEETFAIVSQRFNYNAGKGCWSDIDGGNDTAKSNDALDYNSRRGQIPANYYKESIYNELLGGILTSVTFADDANSETLMAKPTTDNNTGINGNPRYTNMDVVVYGEAERLIILEQLTSYFPSSLIYSAPRTGLFIDNKHVPKKAKKLLVFRTKSLHSNDYIPNSYGLVKEVDIVRYDTDMAIINQYITANKGDAIYYPIDEPEKARLGLYFFDDIKDSELDFAYDIEQYDGIRKALHSRYNLPFQDRIFYAAFTEEYNPLQPYQFPADYWQGNGNPIMNVLYEPQHILLDPIAGSDDGFVGGTFVTYKYYYVDKAGVRSPESTFIIFVPLGNKKVVVLYFMPSAYSGKIDKLKIFRTTDNINYFHVKDLEPEDMGVFVDTGKHHTWDKYETYYPSIVKYENGIRWAEAYQPDFIKYDSFQEVPAIRDGDKMTGMISNYGNILVFKENSIYRYAVQALNPPISRGDLVTSDIGCIAPNALLDVNNTVYFLSWKGLMSYDNNVVKNIDQKFNEELSILLNLGKKYSAIRDATIGYNSTYNEIYLNIPPLKEREDIIQKEAESYNVINELTDPFTQPKIYNANPVIIDIDYENAYKLYEYEDTYYDLQKRLFGHIYVINLNTGLSYKYGYQPSVTGEEASGITYIRKMLSNMSNIRLYKTNSLGELRSADIVTSEYGDTLMHAGMYIETPYNISGTLYRDTDEMLNGYYYKDRIITNNEIFPQIYRMPVRSAYKSKFFTGNDENLIKRIREIVLNLYSQGIIRMETVYINYDAIDDRIENKNRLLDSYTNTSVVGSRSEQEEKYIFNPTETYDRANRYGVVNMGEIQWQPLIKGTGKNILKIIPNSNYQNNQTAGEIFDLNGKPVKFSIEIYTEFRTQLNQISYYWRPIHVYL